MIKDSTGCSAAIDESWRGYNMHRFFDPVARYAELLAKDPEAPRKHQSNPL